MQQFGSTRSVVTREYALITPETQIRAPLPGYEGCQVITHISPRMGAEFTQLTVEVGPGGRLGTPRDGYQRFLYVLEGEVRLAAGSDSALTAGGYAYIPAGQEHQVASQVGARVAIFDKRYVALGAGGAPEMLVSSEQAVAAAPYLGDEDALLQVLLPDSPSFDMAVNIFTFKPGAAHPFVEVHVMEHGLLMLQGGGIYRLGTDYHPVQTGDIIWMGPYCAQWFCAVGKEPAKYIYYKDVNRGS